MRTLEENEIESISGGQISGYEGAGAVLTVLATGAAIATAPIGIVVVGFALGVAGGLAIAQYLARNGRPSVRK